MHAGFITVNAGITARHTYPINLDDITPIQHLITRNQGQGSPAVEINEQGLLWGVMKCELLHFITEK